MSDCVLCAAEESALIRRPAPVLWVALGVMVAQTKSMRDEMCESHRTRLASEIQRGRRLAGEVGVIP